MQQSIYFFTTFCSKRIYNISISTPPKPAGQQLIAFYANRRDADVIYSLRAKSGEKIYALLHLEAQSRHDKKMAMRVFEYQVALGRAYVQRGYEKIPLILTYVLYHGLEKWSSPTRIAELFDDFDLYCDVACKSPFLINLTEQNLAKLKKQEAAAAPQMLMRQQASGEYCEVLGDLWEVMKKNDQLDEENINYMVTNDKHEEEDFIEKISKFDAETSSNYKIMFERAIKRTEIETAKKLKNEIFQKLISQGFLNERQAREVLKMKKSKKKDA